MDGSWNSLLAYVDTPFKGALEHIAERCGCIILAPWFNRRRPERCDLQVDSYQTGVWCVGEWLGDFRADSRDYLCPTDSDQRGSIGLADGPYASMVLSKNAACRFAHVGLPVEMVVCLLASSCRPSGLTPWATKRW
jgi:hypothetical protein